MSSIDTLLRLAYAANILILLPVLFVLHRDRGAASLAVFDRTVANSDGLRQLVMALWLAIAACSALGLLAPRFFLPVLLLQVFYKSAWLVSFVLPRLRRVGRKAVPWGVTISFLVIVALWPFLLARALYG